MDDEDRSFGNVEVRVLQPVHILVVKKFEGLWVGSCKEQKFRTNFIRALWQHLETQSVVWMTAETAILPITDLRTKKG